MRYTLQNLHEMDDASLVRLRNAVAEESSRRFTIHQLDNGYVLTPSQHYVWPGVLAAAILAPLPVTVVGGPGTGRTTLRAILARVSPDTTSCEVWPCPCGLYFSKNTKCGCGKKARQEHYRKHVPAVGVGIYLPLHTSVEKLRGERHISITQEAGRIAEVRAALQGRRKLPDATFLETMRKMVPSERAARTVAMVADALYAMDGFPKGQAGDPRYLYEGGAYRPPVAPT